MRELHKYIDNNEEHFVAIDCENDILKQQLSELTIDSFILYTIFAFGSFRDIQYQLDYYIKDAIKDRKFDKNVSLDDKLELIDKLINSIEFDFDIEAEWGPSIYDYSYISDDTDFINYFFSLSKEIGAYKRSLKKK